MDLRNCIDLRPSYMRIKDWPAVLYLTNPRGGATKYLCQVCGLGLPGAEITLRIDSTRIARTSVDEFGRWCFEKEVLPLLKKGDHYIKIVHSDGIGANENAYATIYITDDPSGDNIDGKLKNRDDYCAGQYDPTLNMFQIDALKPSDEDATCLSDADVGTAQLAGRFVNKGYLPKHTLKFRIFNSFMPSVVDQWVEEINTVAASNGTWKISPVGNDKWKNYVEEYFDAIGTDATATFCIEAWDLNIGAYDTMCFCVNHIHP